IWGRGAAGAKQPFATYFAKVRLTNVLDLTDPEVLLLLRLKFKDLYADWRGASSPTKTQLLGLAVSAPHSNIAAIRYPSRAAQSTRTAATNLVIFPNQISAPDYVRILGPQKRPLQAWP
ncbi:MAG TPA: RES domain-containing protein, partial [Clostridia bacterium]|nr:RES domain-containing protein [Clostridia bacterium]